MQMLLCRKAQKAAVTAETCTSVRLSAIRKGAAVRPLIGLAYRRISSAGSRRYPCYPLGMIDADVTIIGGGAAGLMCAIAAGQRGRRVVVLEGSNKIGKKILMSGGGRCNFTNLHSEPSRFTSTNPQFCISALSRYTQWDFIALVEKHGIAWHEKTLGQLFCDKSSKDIVAMLLAECESAGVDVRTHCEKTVVTTEDGFRVSCNQGSFGSESLVIATGGLSIPKMGASDLGYRLAQQFGLNVFDTPERSDGEEGEPSLERTVPPSARSSLASWIL